jgi:hypothetical protein
MLKSSSKSCLNDWLVRHDQSPFIVRNFHSHATNSCFFRFSRTPTQLEALQRIRESSLQTSSLCILQGYFQWPSWHATTLQSVPTKVSSCLHEIIISGTHQYSLPVSHTSTHIATTCITTAVMLPVLASHQQSCATILVILHSSASDYNTKLHAKQLQQAAKRQQLTLPP